MFQQTKQIWDSLASTENGQNAINNSIVRQGICPLPLQGCPKSLWVRCSLQTHLAELEVSVSTKFWVDHSLVKVTMPKVISDLSVPNQYLAC